MNAEAITANAIVALAERVLGSREGALAWLRWPSPALGGQTPISLLDTDKGRHSVETILGRIEAGVFT